MNNFSKEYLINEISELQLVAKQIAEKLKLGDTVLLFGDLGAGKTTLTSKILKELGVKDIVNSPTFSLVKEYRGTDFVIYHFDVYRITEDEAIEAGFDEMIQDNNVIKFIEWSDNVKKLLPESCITIEIENLGEEKRKIRVRG